MVVEKLNYGGFGYEEEREGERERKDGGRDGLGNLETENCEEL